MTLQRQPGPEHERLGVFVGRWRTEGEIVGGGRLRAIDRYEWVPGRFFLLHTVEGTMDGSAVNALEVIGWDAERGCYVSRSYDDQGNVADYEATLGDRSWTIVGGTERFVGAFDAGHRTLRGDWERLGPDGEWSPWMSISLTREDGPAR